MHHLNAPQAPPSDGQHGSMYVTWRDSVETRLGRAMSRADEADSKIAELRADTRAIVDRIDALGARMAGEIATQIGAIRADVKSAVASQVATPRTGSLELDIKALLLVAALIAAGLVGVGISVGRSWQDADTRDVVREVLTP